MNTTCMKGDSRLQRKNRNIILKWGLLPVIFLAAFFRIIQWLLGWSDFSKYWLNGAAAVLLTAAFIRTATDPLLLRRIRFNMLDAAVSAFLVHGVLITVLTFMAGHGAFTALNGFRTYFFGTIVYFLVRLTVTKSSEALSVARTIMIMLTIVGAELILEFGVMNFFLKDWTVFPWIYQGTMMAFGDSPERIKVASAVTDEFMFRPLGLLGYVHYSAYAAGLGVLLTAPYVINHRAEENGRTAYKASFALLLIALFCSTTRSILLMTVFLLFITAAKERSSFKGFGFLLMLVTAGTLFSVKAGAFSFLESFLKGNDGFYDSFQESPFSNLAGTNPLELIFGRGFEAGIYESFQFGDTEIAEHGFHFNQISDQIHFFYYMDRVGLVGGALFLLQAGFGIKAALANARNSDDKTHKALCAGLSSSFFLWILSAAHILHSDIVMQFFNYSLLGVSGSLKQASDVDETVVIPSP